MSLRSRVWTSLIELLLVLAWIDAGVVNGQTSESAPRILSFSGTLVDAQGQLRSGSTGITFAICAGAKDGPPLWNETQIVPVSPTGRFDVRIGGTRGNRSPLELFTSNEAYWLILQVEGDPEQRARLSLVGNSLALHGQEGSTLVGSSVSALERVDDSNSLERPKSHEVAPATKDDQFIATTAIGPGFTSLATGGPPIKVSSSEWIQNLRAC